MGAGGCNSDGVNDRRVFIKPRGSCTRWADNLDSSSMDRAWENGGGGGEEGGLKREMMVR